MQHVRQRGEVHIRFWWRDLREGGHLEDLGSDVRIILKWIFKINNYIDLVYSVSVRYCHMFRPFTSGYSSTTNKKKVGGGRGLFLQTEASALFTLLVYQCPTDDG